jgi:hypothetical protein
MTRICVYCGSSVGARPEYAAAARELGAVLAGRGIGLVYGGTNIGLMGVVADTMIAAGAEVIGVIPEALVARERAHQSVTELRVVGSMHERKALMADLADGFIALPGGLGTLEELFEALTWAQLGLHAKPCGLLDVAGYYADLTRLLDRAVRDGFVPPSSRARLVVDTDPARLVDRLARERVTRVDRPIDRGRM